MEIDTIEKQLIHIFSSEIFHHNDFDRESDLFGLGLDSMGIMQVLIRIEQQFGVQFSPYQVSIVHFSKISDIANNIHMIINNMNNGNEFIFNQ